MIQQSPLRQLVPICSTGKKYPYYCDCGAVAHYWLPVIVRPSITRYMRKDVTRRVNLQLCDACLRLEIELRRQIPAKGDL